MSTYPAENISGRQADSRPSRAARKHRKSLRAKGALALVGVAAGGGLLAAGVNKVAQMANQTRGYENDQSIALRGVNQGYGSVIVLKSGAEFTVTPTSYGKAGNKPQTVPQGEELVVDTPVISATNPAIGTLDESGWIGFTAPGTNMNAIHSAKDRAAVTVWADLNALQDEGLADMYANSAPAGHTVTARVDANGAVRINSKLDPNAATSFVEKAGTYHQAAQ